MRNFLNSSLAVEANLKFNVRYSPRLITELSQHHVAMPTLINRLAAGKEMPVTSEHWWSRTAI